MTRSHLMFAHPPVPEPVGAPPEARLHEHVAPPPPRAVDRPLAHDERWERLLVLFELLEHGMSALAEQLQARIPSYELYWGYSPNATLLTSQEGPGQVTTLAPRSSDLVLVDGITAFLPAGATGTLTLGSVVLPLGAPASSNWIGAAPVLALVGQRILLSPRDVRSLSSSTAGPMALLLSAEVAPTRGKLPL
jgi:hypothetical protein